MIVSAVEEAVAQGASRKEASDLVGVSGRTEQRWRKNRGGEDGRRGPKSTPKHALTAEERAKIIAIVTSKEFRNMSVRQIVPLLADTKKLYVASESTIYRVMHEAGLMTHREHSRPSKGSKPNCHVATGPCQVWSWDITYLLSPVCGVFFYLYLIVDIWSRRIMGWAVHTEESQEHAAALIAAAAKAAGVDAGTLVLHADNGGPMRGGTMLAMLRGLGITPSFSRPRVSDDNPFSEALFRTLKYVPNYPRRPFENAGAARAWVERFACWYNGEHLHSGIGFVTPDARHRGQDAAQLAARRAVYERAREAHPSRWSGATRRWGRPAEVTLNAKEHQGRKERSASSKRTKAAPSTARTAASELPAKVDRQGPEKAQPVHRADNSRAATPRYGAILEGRYD